jgi:hypothetical protein
MSGRRVPGGASDTMTGRETEDKRRVWLKRQESMERRDTTTVNKRNSWFARKEDRERLVMMNHQAIKRVQLAALLAGPPLLLCGAAQCE